jgi:putative transposase
MIDLPRSTYYYRSTAKALNLGDSELVAIIEDIQDELPCYGYRRVTHELQRRGHLVNHKRVARVMRANGLGIKPRKRYVRTTDSNHDSPIYPNLYRNVIPARPDMVWVADFTYIRIAAGFCYLAVILDACSRKVVGVGGRSVCCQTASQRRRRLGCGRTPKSKSLPATVAALTGSRRQRRCRRRCRSLIDGI